MLPAPLVRPAISMRTATPRPRDSSNLPPCATLRLCATLCLRRQCSAVGGPQAWRATSSQPSHPCRTLSVLPHTALMLRRIATSQTQLPRYAPGPSPQHGSPVRTAQSAPSGRESNGQRQAREDAPQAAWRQPAGARVVSSQPQLSREPCAVRGLVIQGIGGLVSPLVRVSYSADAACRCRLPAHRRPRRRPRRRVSPPSLALKGGV